MGVPAEFGALPQPFEHHDSELTTLAQAALNDVVWLGNARLATEFETPRPFTGGQERRVIYGRLADIARRMGTLGLEGGDVMEDAADIYEQLDVQVGVARTARSLFEQVSPHTANGSQLTALGHALRDRRVVTTPVEEHLREVHEVSLELTSPSAIAAISTYFQTHKLQRHNYKASVSEANDFSVADILFRAKPLVWGALYGFASPEPETHVALDALEHHVRRVSYDTSWTL